MDFRHQILGADALAGLTCDALVLIVTGDAVDTTLDAPLGAALADALAHDDLKLKAGKCIYLHRPAGVRAPRVVFSVAGAKTAKAFKAAVAVGIQQVKATGAKHVAVGLAGFCRVFVAHDEACDGHENDKIGALVGDFRPWVWSDPIKAEGALT